ncbi:MAG: putative phosphatase [Candidatus Scalindua rubra]|uniref:Putative phosphatase n=1 Tax=Candidatus Scalindua rubra TaxID=1872076 RepID=A0A1E3XE08_9BACT|nr:MAG: putative phosphatase [Candidatus Scalindua rubra]
MLRNFSWLIKGEIAGMARPESTIKNFEILKDNDIEAIVSLTDFSLDKGLIEEFGFEVKYIPVKDFNPPGIEQIEDFLDFAKRIRADGKKLVVYCDAGLGRTGTMLACYLVDKGINAAKAIEIVRRKRPNSIETEEQKKVIFKFWRKIRKISKE